MRSNKGFTLLELLLVLAILAILAASGLAAYRQKITNFKVEQTALQMQQILQAAQVIYSDTGSWPPQDDKAFANYLVGTPLETCPWMAADKNNPCYKIISDPKDAKFELALTLPAGLSHPDVIGNMIVARLPNASYTASTQIVNAAVPKMPTPPTPSSSGVQLASIQVVPAGVQDVTLKNNCGANSTQEVYILPTGYTSSHFEHKQAGLIGISQTDYFLFKRFESGYSSNPSTSPPVIVKPDNPKLLDKSYTALEGTYGSDTLYESTLVYVLVMEVCVPNPSASNVNKQQENNNSGPTRFF